MRARTKQIGILTISFAALALLFTNAGMPDFKFAANPEAIDWNSSIDRSRSDLAGLFDRVEEMVENRFGALVADYDQAILSFRAAKNLGAEMVVTDARVAALTWRKYIKESIADERRLALNPFIVYDPSRPDIPKESSNVSEAPVALGSGQTIPFKEKDPKQDNDDDKGKAWQGDSRAVTRLPTGGYVSGMHNRTREFAYRAWRWNSHYLKIYVKENNDPTAIMLMHVPLDEVFSLLGSLRTDLQTYVKQGSSYYLPAFLAAPMVARGAWATSVQGVTIAAFEAEVREARQRMILSLMLSTLNKLYLAKVNALSPLFDDKVYPFALKGGRIASFKEDNGGVFRLYQGPDVVSVQFSIHRASKREKIKQYRDDAASSYRYGKYLAKDKKWLENSYPATLLETLGSEFQSCLGSFNATVTTLNNAGAGFAALIPAQMTALKATSCVARPSVEFGLSYLDKIAYTKAIDLKTRQYFEQRKIEHAMNGIKKDLKQSGKKGHLDFSKVLDRLDEYAGAIDYLRFATDRKPYDSGGVTDFQSTYRRLAIEGIGAGKIFFTDAEAKAIDEILATINGGRLDTYISCLGGPVVDKSKVNKSKCAKLTFTEIREYNKELLSNINSALGSLNLNKRVLKSTTTFTNAPNIYRFNQADLVANILKWDKWDLEAVKVTCKAKASGAKTFCGAGGKVVLVSTPSKIIVSNSGGNPDRNSGQSGTSTVACIEGVNFGFSGNEVWVSGKCSFDDNMVKVVKK